MSMIRIKKPAAIPEKLREEGKRETEKNNSLYEHYEQDFMSGVKILCISCLFMDIKA